MVDRLDSLRAAVIAADLAVPEAAIPSHPLGVDEIRRMEELRLQIQGLQAAVDPIKREIDLNRRKIIRDIPIVKDTTPIKI